MTVDYDKIHKEIIGDPWKNVQETAKFASEMYSDRTHFMLELLQNAEDTVAKRVVFRLYQDRLEFEHDGRPFNEADAVGVSGVFRGTKKPNSGQIGRFGVGFKSVYRYTLTPKIHSGPFHFAIEDYVRPCPLPPRDTDLGTLFVFPFDHRKKTEESSHDEIARRLKKLRLRTLLFLKHLKSVEYCIDGDSTGAYCRRIEEEYPGGFARKVSIVRQVGEENEAEENWLVFKRGISELVPQEAANLSVEIAFLLSEAPPNQRPGFQRAPNSSIEVFFPTEIKTGLGFLVQGPYTPTPGRDSIKRDDPFNQTIVCETGALLVDALCWLRDQDWLTVELLRTMPLAYEERKEYWDPSYTSRHSYVHTEQLYDSFLEPVFDAFRQALLTEALIPSSDGNYVSAQDAKIAGSVALRDLLDSSRSRESLGFDEDSRWISKDITRTSTPNLWRFLTTVLEIDQIDDEKIARRINHGFLTKQTDDWMRQFYESLPSGYSIQAILRDKPIIRLRDGSHVTPFGDFGKLQAYLPTAQETQFLTVKPDVCNSSKARRALENLGLKEPDIVDEVLNVILRKYEGGRLIGDDEHRQDMQVILQAMDVDSRQRQRTLQIALESASFLVAENATGEAYYCKPGEIYVRSSQLEQYFADNPDVWFLSAQYEPYLGKLWPLGIKRRVQVLTRRIDADGFVRLPRRFGGRGSTYDPYVRGLQGFDPDISVDGLEFALKNPTLERACFIWNQILPDHIHCIAGRIQKSTRQDFSRIFHDEMRDSNLGTLVREMAWLPDGRDGFVPPSGLALDDLPEGFRRDADLANALEMRTSFGAAIETVLNNDDMPESDAKLLAELKDSSPEERQLLLNALRDLRIKNIEGKGDRHVTESGDTMRRFKSAGREDQELDDSVEETHTEYPETSALYSNLNRPGETQLSNAFIPPRPLPDTDFRHRRTQEEIENARANEPGESERSRQASRKIWECADPATREFLHQQYGGNCQICRMTFPKRDGKPYFEAIYLEPRIKARWLDRPGNSLCLCANHAAQFIQGAREFVPDFREQVMSYEYGEQHDVTLTLIGEHKTIRYTQRHIIDLKAIVESEISDS